MPDPTPESVAGTALSGGQADIQLRTFGGLALTRGGQPVPGSGAQPGRVAILAAIARAGAAGVSRDKIIGLFWPESPEEKARASLRQSLYALRRDARAELVTGTTDLRLNPSVVWCDVYDFDAAIAVGDLERAVSLHSGPFLDGVYLRFVPEFERWAARERSVLLAKQADALALLAARASADRDTAAMVRWTRRLAATDPTNGKFACQLIEALALDGQREAAVRHAREHADITRAELGVEPDATVLALEQRLSNARTPASASPVPAPPPAATADAPAVNRVTPQPQRSGHWRRLHRPALRGALAVLAAGLVIVAVALTHDAHGAAPARSAMRTIDVLPFDVAGTDSAASGVGRAVSIMLADQLRVDSIIGAVAVAGGAPPAPGDSSFIRSGRRTGPIGDVVQGTAVLTRDIVTLEATIVDSTHRPRAPAVTVSGPRDSLGAVVAALAEHLLAIQGDSRPSRTDILVSEPLPALREYAAGRVLLARGRYDDAADRFERALAIDSTFVYAALGLGTASVSDAASYRESFKRALALAWNGRDALPSRDRALVLALAGPHYPQMSSAPERIAAWSSATQAAPEYAESWYGLGDVYFHSGGIAGLHNAMLAAKVAFERSLEADERYLPALQHLVDVSVHLRDTTAARRYTSRYLRVDSSSAAATYVRWRLASLTGDWNAAPAFRGAPMLATRWLIEVAPNDGLGMQAAWTAIRARDAHPEASVADRVETSLARHALALNDGHPLIAAGIRDELAALEPTDTMDIRLPILAALYGDGDEASGSAAARDLAGLYALDDLAHGRSTLPGDAAARDDRMEALCIVGQWRATKGDSAFADAAARVLSDASRLSERVGIEAAWCAGLLRSMIATSPSVATLDSMDAVLADGANLRRSGLHAGQAAARQFMRAGDPARALRSVRRRGYFGRWPYYFATSLREEARYALATRDTTAAACALDLFLALRAQPEPALAPAVAAAARQRAALHTRALGCAP